MVRYLGVQRTDTEARHAACFNSPEPVVGRSRAPARVEAATDPGEAAMRPVSLSGAFLLVLALASNAAAAILYDEGVSGPLSNNRLAPTALVAALGTNSVIATSQAGDREYWSITLAAGTQLSAINLVSYSGTDIAFIAVQSGTTFTEPPTGTNVANLLGYTHFGPGAGGATGDILDNM